MRDIISGKDMHLNENKHLENQRSILFKVNQLIIISRELIDTLESGIKGSFNNWGGWKND